MDCTITQTIVHAAHVVHRNVLTSYRLLCAGRHSWSHVRAPLYEDWRGPRSVGARYSLQKEKWSVLNSPLLPVLAHSWQHLGHITQPR